MTMTAVGHHELRFLAKLVIAIAVLLIIAGVLWHGVTLEGMQRIWDNLLSRPNGPKSFRFILQPLMAAIAAIRDGAIDARTGNSPYFLTVLRNSNERVSRLSEGLNATARIVLLGLMMDVIYQWIVFETFFPVEAVIISLLLAFVPYILLRGPAARFLRWQHRGRQF